MAAIESVALVVFTTWIEDVDVMKDLKDNWNHRSANMRCETCMWFAVKVGIDDDAPGLGRCRRRSPTLSGWPVMFTDDWCGDHKLDETKI